ncbi:hypothetical protein C0Q70_01353 [Pomacea canaliculata]|uniref:Uncharacterized protein n=1 Tax=Pomacea canaliculata TaxID=400727 RepID=A0A2T7PZ88_POMCA|nr:hypothetical protein C0Q70_01353 [Pomacea canaliculata]
MLGRRVLAWTGETLTFQVWTVQCGYRQSSIKSNLEKCLGMSATNISARNTTSACTEHRGHRGECARPHGKVLQSATEAGSPRPAGAQPADAVGDDTCSPPLQ